MSVVEETRKAIQDFLAPELRGQKSRMDGVDHRLKSIEDTLKEMRAEAKEMHAEARADSAHLRSLIDQSRVETKADIARLCGEFQAVHKDLEAEMKLGFREVRSDMRLSERVEKIEKTISAEQQHESAENRSISKWQQ